VAEFQHVGADVLEGWSALALQACAALEAMGLPAHVRGDGEPRAGVEIAVDSGADSAGGVFATWHFGMELRLRMMDIVANRDFSNPLIERTSMAAQVMFDAVSSLFRLAGFTVEYADDDLRSFALRILSAPVEEIMK
jgi:hypothetical protein